MQFCFTGPATVSISILSNSYLKKFFKIKFSKCSLVFCNFFIVHCIIPNNKFFFIVKPTLEIAYALAIQLISFLQGTFCACSLKSLLIWTPFWICPLPLNSFSMSWFTIDIWAFYLFYCVCPVSQAPFWHVVEVFKLLTDKQPKEAGDSKAWALEPWQAGLCSSPAAALSEQVAELTGSLTGSSVSFLNCFFPRAVWRNMPQMTVFKQISPLHFTLVNLNLTLYAVAKAISPCHPSL